MKKYLISFLVVVMLLSLAGCGDEQAASNEVATEVGSSVEEKTDNEDDSVEEKTDTEDNIVDENTYEPQDLSSMLEYVKTESETKISEIESSAEE